MKIRDNVRIYVDVQVVQVGGFPENILAGSERKYTFSGGIDEIETRVREMGATVISEVVNRLTIVDSADREAAPVDMEALAKNAAGIK